MEIKNDLKIIFSLINFWFLSFIFLNSFKWTLKVTYFEPDWCYVISTANWRKSHIFLDFFHTPSSTRNSQYPPILRSAVSALRKSWSFNFPFNITKVKLHLVWQSRDVKSQFISSYFLTFSKLSRCLLETLIVFIDVISLPTSLYSYSMHSLILRLMSWALIMWK